MIAMAAGNGPELPRLPTCSPLGERPMRKLTLVQKPLIAVDTGRHFLAFRPFSGSAGNEFAAIS
jgi:hypothetical protein